MLPIIWLRRNVQLSLLATALLFGACTSDGASSADDATTIPAVTTELEGEISEDAEVPDEYVTAALADVAQRTSTDVANLTVLDSSVVEWANARLGCVQFDDSADFAPIDGFRIVIATDSAQFDYRLGADGVPRLCGDAVEASPPDDDHDDEPIEAETE